jgi:hypothetical protein
VTEKKRIRRRITRTRRAQEQETGPKGYLKNSKVRNEAAETWEKFESKGRRPERLEKNLRIKEMRPKETKQKIKNEERGLRKSWKKL